MSAEFTMPPSSCPHCGVKFAAAAVPSNPKFAKAPSPGELCVCMTCLEILQFEGDLRAAAIDPMELLRRRLDPAQQEFFERYDATVAAEKRKRMQQKAFVCVISAHPVRPTPSKS